MATWSGILLGGVGLGLLDAGMDQGNRLDWLNSGTVVGLLLAGGLLMVSFVVNEVLVAGPLIDIKALRNPNILLPPILVTIFLFGTSATSFLLPDYLTRVQDLRSLQIADVVNWIALPQFVIVPLVAFLLRYIDARLMLAAGLAVIAIGSWMNTELTHDWAAADFLRSQLVESVGLALALTSLVTFAAANIRPALAATIAGLIQSGRVLGSEIGSSFMQTYVRVQEQVTSKIWPASSSRRARRLPSNGPRSCRMSSAIDSARLAAIRRARHCSLSATRSAARPSCSPISMPSWFIAWLMTASLLLLLFLRPPPPNPMTPPRLPDGGRRGADSRGQDNSSRSDPAAFRSPV